MMSLLTPAKLLFRLALALFVLACVMSVCVFIGSRHIWPAAAINALLTHDVTSPDYQILIHVRLSRVILSAVIGAALACSGTVFQAFLKNPLADPYILGISSGAGLGAIIAVITGFGWTILGGSAIAVCAFCGALATAWLVWLIGRFACKNSVTGLLLAGVVVNAIFSALIMFLVSVAGSERVYSTIFWLMGNIEEVDFISLWFALGFVVTAITGLFFLAAPLNAISLDAQDAQSSGINVAAVRMIAFSIASAVTAVAVALGGLIGFVGLLVPHSVRLILGPDHRQLIPLSACVGAAFMVGADTIARIIVAPAQLPVGVVTALAGGPVFVFLLVRYINRGAIITR